MKNLIVKLSGIFGFDLFVYHELVYHEKEYLFRSRPWYHPLIRIFLYVVILMMAIAFLVLFAVLQNHPGILIPTLEAGGKLVMVPAKAEVLHTNWLHLLFGVIYLLMVYKTFVWLFNLFRAEHGKVSARKRKRLGLVYGNADNILYSFDYAFMWYIIIICGVRLALDFTIGHYQVVMNPHNRELAETANMTAFGSAYWYHGVECLYFILIITTCALVLIYIFGYLVKPELKEQYIHQIKAESILYLTKDRVNHRLNKVESHNAEPNSDEAVCTKAQRIKWGKKADEQTPPDGDPALDC